jgi:hypothetical protein
MSNIKRNGTLARPGEYLLRGKKEIRTQEELEKAIKKHEDGIMLTYGHATDGSPIPGATQFVGKAFPYWDSEKKVVLANYSFFEEYWENIPENIRNKIVNDDAVPISIGYRVDDVETDGTQRGILFTHVALVPDGEEPIADNVGVNIRMESERELERELELPPNYRLESGEIPEVETPEAESETVETPEYVTKIDFDAWMAKFDAFLESQKPVEKSIVEPEPALPIQEEQEMVAEVQIPVGERRTQGPNIVGGVVSTHSS